MNIDIDFFRIQQNFSQYEVQDNTNKEIKTLLKKIDNLLTKINKEKQYEQSQLLAKKALLLGYIEKQSESLATFLEAYKFDDTNIIVLRNLPICCYSPVDISKPYYFMIPISAKADRHNLP